MPGEGASVVLHVDMLSPTATPGSLQAPLSRGHLSAADLTPPGCHGGPNSHVHSQDTHARLGDDGAMLLIDAGDGYMLD